MTFPTKPMTEPNLMKDNWKFIRYTYIRPFLEFFPSKIVSLGGYFAFNGINYVENIDTNIEMSQHRLGTYAQYFCFSSM